MFALTLLFYVYQRKCQPKIYSTVFHTVLVPTLSCATQIRVLPKLIANTSTKNLSKSSTAFAVYLFISLFPPCVCGLISITKLTFTKNSPTSDILGVVGNIYLGETSEKWVKLRHKCKHTHTYMSYCNKQTHSFSKGTEQNAIAYFWCPIIMYCTREIKTKHLGFLIHGTKKKSASNFSHIVEINPSWHLVIMIVLLLIVSLYYTQEMKCRSNTPGS